MSARMDELAKLQRQLDEEAAADDAAFAAEMAQIDADDKEAAEKWAREEAAYKEQLAKEDAEHAQQMHEIAQKHEARQKAVADLKAHVNARTAAFQAQYQAIRADMAGLMSPTELDDTFDIATLRKQANTATQLCCRLADLISAHAPK